MLIAQSIANLLNGVSQRPQEQRHSSQADEQTNGLSHLVRGLMKRPPLVYVGKLASVTTGWSTAFLHSINRDESERYHIVVANGGVQVYDALTAAPVTVIARGGTSYLTDSTAKGFRAATAGDTTLIVNRGKTVKRGATKTAAATNEALVYVRQADYGTTYQVTLNSVPVAIKTVAGTAAPAREQISTEKIATDLYTALTTEPLLSSIFTFTRYGSTIHMVRAAGQDFTLSTFDGLSDKGLKAVKGSVQDFADLPRRAPNGFRVEVVGDLETARDNYWVQFDDANKPAQEGVWREVPAPGTLVDLDASTMPHRLVRNGPVLHGVKHESPKGPTPADLVDIIEAGTNATVIAWAFTTPGPVAVPAGTAPEVRDHGAGVQKTLAAAYVRMLLDYSIDTSLVEQGNDVTVTLYLNGVAQASKFHAAGYSKTFQLPWGNVVVTRQGGSFDLTQAFANTDVVDVKIAYAKGVTPDAYRRAYFVPSSPTFVSVGIREARFYTSGTYPVGSTITVTVSGTPFAYVVTSTPKDGPTVAAALQALIDADAALIATIGTPTSRVRIKRNDNTYPTITAVLTFNDAVICYNSTLALTTNEFVGYILRNVTDGSTGTVVSNTAQTVSVGALAGGKDNLFQAGDDITISSALATSFTFEPCPWNARGAGDLELVPFPSFVDATISDVFFYQNRLGFTSRENLVCSSAGDVFNFFRYTATQLLADDVIDVRSSHKEVSLFHSAVLWNGDLFLISDNAQWRVSGDPVLTPSTIRIDLARYVPNTPGPRPVVNGNRLYLTRGKGGFTQVNEFFVADVGNGTTVDSINVTQDVPKYIKGKPLAVVGDETLGILALLTDANDKTLYVYSYHFDDNERSRVQSSWSKWTLGSGQIVGLDMVDGKLGVVTVHSDGSYLHTIDLNVELASTDTTEGSKYLDRRVVRTTTGVSAAFNILANTTTWTLPFNVATDGSDGALAVVRQDPRTVYPVTRPAANQIAVTGFGNLTAVDVYIGVLYEFRYKLSRIYFRKDEVPETGGRLQLRYMNILFHDTTDFQVVVTPAYRTAYTYAKAYSAVGDGKFRTGIQTRNEAATIELVNATPGVCAFSSLDWEGSYDTRNRRV